MTPADATPARAIYARSRPCAACHKRGVHIVWCVGDQHVDECLLCRAGFLEPWTCWTVMECSGWHVGRVVEP